MCAKDWSLLMVVSALSFIDLGFSEAFADVIVSDPFNYAAGVLDGNDGGTGWGGAWSGNNDNMVVNPGLTYPGVSCAGNAVQISQTIKETTRPLATTLGGNSGSLWIGFLAKGVGNLPSNTYAGISFYSDTAEKMFLGLPYRHSQWGLGITGSGNLDSGVVADANSVCYAARVDFDPIGGTDSIHVWINPSLNMVPSDSSANISGTRSHFTFNTISVQGNVGFVYDELKIGSEFTDVIEIPEPATVYLACSGVIGLLAYAWRKR